MNLDELERLLQQTIADPTLTKNETAYIQHWVRQYAPNVEQFQAARQCAVAVAQAHLGATTGPILQWLAGVWDVLQPSDEPGQAFFSPGTTCVNELVHQFNNAKQHCDVCVFTITDNRITDAIEAAHRRGVAVRVISDDEKAHDTGSDIHRLVASGIPCKTDNLPAHMHHKFALFDRRRLVTGSFNWTRSASEQNEENLIVTPDVGLVTSFLARFEKLWAKYKFFA